MDDLERHQLVHFGRKTLVDQMEPDETMVRHILKVNALDDFE